METEILEIQELGLTAVTIAGSKAQRHPIGRLMLFGRVPPKMVTRAFDPLQVYHHNSFAATILKTGLERDDFSSKCHLAPAFCLSMIFFRKTGVHFSGSCCRLSPVSSENFASQEIVMATSRARQRATALAFGATGLLWASVALASQGPGAGRGTASGFTQLAMAIVVYGVSALVIGAGLVGATRRH